MANGENVSNALGLGLFGRPAVRGLYYNGQTIRLDGYSWENCRFDNCFLEIVSTNFDVKNCIIDSSNTIWYSPEMLKPIKLFTSRFDWAPQHFPEAFLASRNLTTDAITL